MINKALSVNPAERYGTMEEMAHALESTATTGVFSRLFKR